jgi:hypothetical protein
MDLRQRGRIDPGRVRQDLLQHRSHLEIVRVALVVIDVAACQGGLIQVPDEQLLVGRQLVEPVGVQLDDRRLVHALEEVFARLRCAGRSGRRGLHRWC